MHIAAVQEDRPRFGEDRCAPGGAFCRAAALKCGIRNHACCVSRRRAGRKKNRSLTYFELSTHRPFIGAARKSTMKIVLNLSPLSLIGADKKVDLVHFSTEITRSTPDFHIEPSTVIPDLIRDPALCAVLANGSRIKSGMTRGLAASN